MNQTEIIADVLARNLEFLKMTLADFSDADILTRPVPASNHAAWQLGHLTTSESRMIEAVQPGAGGGLAPGFAEKFTQETTRIDDPAAFPKKAELIEQLSIVRAATIKWAKGLTAADLSKPAPEKMSKFAPTIGHLATTLPVHAAMHVGQFQVIRRKLGKPILF